MPLLASQIIALNGLGITVVANYSALPLPSAAINKVYFCENAQGTKWIGVIYGGTYYPAGTYYSNGVVWKQTDLPYQANQATTDADTVTDQFVSPNTLANYYKWSSIINGDPSFEAVIDQLNNPPAHVSGERYLGGLAPTGAWAGFPNYIFESNGVSWTATAPILNNTVYLTSTGQTLKYNGTIWAAGNASPVLQNGNSFGSSLIIGTKDNFDILFKRNNITKASVTSTGFAIRNAANTFQGEFQNAVTANRTWTMPDASGTVILGTVGAANRVMVGASATACNGVAQLTYSAGNMDVTFGANTSTGYTATNNASGGGGGAAISRYSCTAGSNTSLANLGVSFATVGLLVASQSVLSTTSAVGTLFANSNAASTFFKWAIGGTATSNEIMRLISNGLSIGTQADSTSWLDIAASTTGKAHLKLISGATPSAPNNGDIWFDGTDIKMRIGGVTKTFTLV